MTDCKLFFPRGVVLAEPRPDSASGNSGFTLVELIMVVALIGILATLSIPAFNNYTNKTKTARAESEIRTLSTEISGYALDKGNSPATLADINRGGYLDPWKQPYVYNNIPSNGGALKDKLDVFPLNSDYDLYSKGADLNSSATGGLAINDDDIVRFNDGAFVGLRQ